MSKHQIGEKDGADSQSQKKAKFDLPTKDEQKQLQHTDLLMKSNLFKLEVEQLLLEVSGEKKLQKSKVTQWTEKVTEILRNASSYKKLAGSVINEKTLKKAGQIKHRDDLGREGLVEKIWEWKDKHGGIIIQQLKKLGYENTVSANEKLLRRFIAKGVYPINNIVDAYNAVAIRHGVSIGVHTYHRRDDIYVMRSEAPSL